jgi:hypothetical protein
MEDVSPREARIDPQAAPRDMSAEEIAELLDLNLRLVRRQIKKHRQ